MIAAGLPEWGPQDAGRVLYDRELGGLRWTGFAWEPAPVRVCAWCTRVLGVAEGLQPGQATHTICDVCRPRLDAEIARIPHKLASAARAAGECIHGTPPGAWCDGCEAET